MQRERGRASLLGMRVTAAVTATDPGDVQEPPGRRTDRRDALLAVGGWAAVLVAARLIGLPYLRAHDRPLAVDAVPWVGRWEVGREFIGPLVLAAAIGALLVWLLPLVVERARWSLVPPAAGAATALLSWALVQASPIYWRSRSIYWGYGQHTDLVSGPGPAKYLATYVELQPDLGGHLRAHPPGFVLGLWGFEELGLSGTRFHFVLMLLAGAVSAMAVLIAARNVAGETFARRAAPFVALAPVVVWHTNPDVVFGAVALTGVALAVVATGRSDRWGDLMAIGGGLAFAGALLCTYGVALLGLPVLAVGVHRRAWRSLALTSTGGVAGLLIPFAFGFSWLAGLVETRAQYENSLSRSRGYAYWLLGNAATFGALIGPATVAGLRRLRGTGIRVLVLAGLACPILAGLSGMSSAETERIWQPFAPLVLLAGGALWVGSGKAARQTARWWLALQVVVALAFQATLQSPW